MKETILLYNIFEKELFKKYQELCDSRQIRLVAVSDREAAVPLGFLAYGSEEQKADYIKTPEQRDDRSLDGDGKAEGLKAFPEEPMMIFAGFTNPRLTDMLGTLRTAGFPGISLKAVLTEHNALWDSCTLYEHLSEERAQFEKFNN